MKKILFSLFLLCQIIAIKAQNDSLTVYVFLAETCPICQQQTYTLRELYEEYKDKKIGFVGVFPNIEMSNETTRAKFAKKYRLKFPLQLDENQQLTTDLNATTTPQVIVVQHKSNQILYKGKIDNSFERIGKKRQVTTEFYLKNALDEILVGKNVSLQETTPVGCFIIKKE